MTVKIAGMSRRKALRNLAFLNGEWPSQAVLDPLLWQTQFAIAADGAADRLLAVGRSPDVVIGDMDSIKSNPREFKEVVTDLDQNSTDCEKLIAYMEKQGKRSFGVIGAEGGYPDHFLAALMAIAASQLDIVIVFKTGLGFILSSSRPAAIVGLGRVSLLPITPCKGVFLSGVKWPLADAELEPLGAKSVSNQVQRAGELVSAQVLTGKALLFVETDVTGAAE